MKIGAHKNRFTFAIISERPWIYDSKGSLFVTQKAIFVTQNTLIFNQMTQTLNFGAFMATVRKS